MVVYALDVTACVLVNSKVYLQNVTFRYNFVNIRHLSHDFVQTDLAVSLSRVFDARCLVQKADTRFIFALTSANGTPISTIFHCYNKKCITQK